MKLFDVIFEDDDLLVVNKPAGLVCHPTKGDEYSSLISRARLQLGAGSEPRLVNRLDRETSGLVLVAKSSEVAGRLGRAMEQRRIGKTYLAIVHGCAPARDTVVEARLGRDEQSVVAIKDCVRPDGAEASTQFSRLQTWEANGKNFSLLQVHPLGGRKHQIRIHLQHAGHPIVGDKMYSGDESLYLDFVHGRLTEAQRERLILPHQALHAGQLELEWKGERRVFAAPPEDWFQAFIPGGVP